MHSNSQACKSLIYNTIITTIKKKLIFTLYPWFMNPIEIIISALAPHICAGCGLEGTPFCMKCAIETYTVPTSRCYRCARPSPEFQTCPDCRSASPLGCLWTCSVYEGEAKELVKLLKFKRVKAAAQNIALWMDRCLPALDTTTLISAVPTVNNRVRARGYDQARLIAKSLAKSRRLPYSDTLLRQKNTRQVGASRHERFAQLKDVFEVRQHRLIQNRSILLIDDVLTTGATLESAATTLLDKGAGRIDAAVFAH